MSNDPTLNPAAIQALRDLSPDGSQEFLRELIAIYLADTPKQLAQLEDALNRQDAAVATRAAHTLKGSSSNFGAEQLARMAQEIETACKSNNLAAAAAALPDLKRHFAQVVEALQRTAAGS